MKLIAISGKMRAGKDTFGEIFLERFPSFQRVAFADPLKEEYGELHNLSVEEINLHKEVHREGLIAHGAMRRAQNKLYWVNKALEKPFDKIITDLRWDHELEAVKALGGIIIRIESFSSERAKRGKIINDDPSETSLDLITNWDYVIENNGSLEEFRERSLEVINDLR
jgi:phosphomevalonate kinase